MDVALDEQGAVAKEFLDGLVGRMGLDADIALAQPEDDTIELNLEGTDLGLLIGPKGATLLAIQDLTRTVVQRKTSAVNGRIMVDVSGYRRKRKEALTRFARQVADEVRMTGTRRVLEPMSAADRKIVHDTVNDIEGVMTASEGEEPRRRVVIFPERTSASVENSRDVHADTGDEAVHGPGTSSIAVEPASPAGHSGVGDGSTSVKLTAPAMTAGVGVEHRSIRAGDDLPAADPAADPSPSLVLDVAATDDLPEGTDD